jgi:hypothetical protein
MKKYEGKTIPKMQTEFITLPDNASAKAKNVITKLVVRFNLKEKNND